MLKLPITRFVIGLVVCLSSVIVTAKSISERPNIIIILADDLGWGDLGCYGQKDIKTPHLDRMAVEGTRFTRVYAGSTVCAPSRCVLMTGKHTGHARIRGNLRIPLEADDLTIAEHLSSIGYRTGLCGKWGLGEEGTTGAPNLKGFEYFFGYVNQHHAHNYYPDFLVRNEERIAVPNVLGKRDSTGAGVATSKIKYSHDLILGEALDFIRKDEARPFFLYLSLTLPHANNEAGTNGLEVPHFGPYDSMDWPENKKRYASMVSYMDQGVGAVLDLLRRKGIDQKTLVIFTSDNGPHREGGNNPNWFASSGPFRGIKRDLYEGGIRVPAISWWPGTVPAGRVIDSPWWFADIPPVLGRIAGKSFPKNGLDGSELSNLVLGKSSPRAARTFYWEFHEGGFKQAAIIGNLKAVKLSNNASMEIYDLYSDPGEKTNIRSRHPRLEKRFSRFFLESRTESPHWPLK